MPVALAIPILPAGAQQRTFTYQCSEGKTFQAGFLSEAARVTLNQNQVLTLAQIPAASGARYSDGRTTLYTKGKEAFIEVGDQRTYQNCIGQEVSDTTAKEQWRRMTPEEEEQQWENILNNPLGIAALNQLAIEGFISPNCPKTFYINEEYGGFQTLLRVKCPDERGVSAAVGYDEMRVIFNRFESNIESFEIERVYPQEGSPEIKLPE